MRILHVTFIALLAPVLGSCSLLGLDDFALPQCDPEQCASQGGIPGFYDGCVAFECVETGEDLSECQPIVGERCDGADNDCDHIVDEAEATQGYARSIERLFETVGGVRDLSVSSDENIATASWLGSSRSPRLEAGGAKVGVDPALEATALRHVANADVDRPSGGPGESASDTRLATGCRALGSTGDNSLSQCNFAALAVDRFGAGAFAASVSSTGCDAGVLRVGFLEGEGLSEYIVRGPRQRSNSYLGVDLNTDGCSSTTPDACSAARAAREAEPGNTEMACRVDGDCMGDLECVGNTGSETNGYCAPASCSSNSDCGNAALLCQCGVCATQVGLDVRAACGVAAVAVEALPTPAVAKDPQALVGFVSGAVGAPACGEVAADIAVLPTFLEEVEPADFAWVTTAGEARSLVLGRTLGNSAPALAAMPDRDSPGTLVGFGAATGGVALHYVPRATKPQAVVGNSCNDTEPQRLVAGANTPGCCDGDADCTQVLRCDRSRCTGCSSGTPARRRCNPGEGACPAEADFCCATQPLACASSGPEDSEEACMDGCDNDGDMTADCADPGCAAFATCAVPCVDFIEQTCEDYTLAQVRECGEVPPHTGNVELAVFEGLTGGYVNDVAFAFGDETSDSLVLAMVWREIDGAGQATLVFRQVVLELDGSGAAVGVLDMGVLEELADETNGPSAPDIAHADSGFVTAGFERGGRTATGTERGGYYVTWSERLPDSPGRILGRRVAEFDGRRLDAECAGSGCEELLELSARLDGEGLPDARYAQVYEDRGEVLYLYADGNSDVLVGSPMACSPAPISMP